MRRFWKRPVFREADHLEVLRWRFYFAIQRVWERWGAVPEEWIIAKHDDSRATGFLYRGKIRIVYAPSPDQSYWLYSEEHGHVIEGTLPPLRVTFPPSEMDEPFVTAAGEDPVSLEIIVLALEKMNDEIEAIKDSQKADVLNGLEELLG